MPRVELRAPSEPVCPAARMIEGATPAEGGVVCVIKEMDAGKADGILEGTPTGIVIRWGEDPMTLLNLCCGTGEPLVNPDDMADREVGQGHYTGCPIWAAAQEWNLVERLFEFERPEGAPKNVPGVTYETEIQTFGPDGERMT
jgi:hypothetical protein